jgi:predicted AAA+ superfamily ATPase
LALLAGRIGQIVDHVSLAGDVGVSPNTVKAWLSVLEASYLVFSLPPFHNSFGKRYIKRSKVYFTDTGLACRLLGITQASQVEQHFLRGGLFENYVIGEVRKRIDNAGLDRALSFYRDSRGNEVDLIIDDHSARTAVEIKSSSTFSRSFLTGLTRWQDLAPDTRARFLVYPGQPGTVSGVDLVNSADLTPLLA